MLPLVIQGCAGALWVYSPHGTFASHPCLVLFFLGLDYATIASKLIIAHTTKYRWGCCESARLAVEILMCNATRRSFLRSMPCLPFPSPSGMPPAFHSSIPPFQFAHSHRSPFNAVDPSQLPLVVAVVATETGLVPAPHVQTVLLFLYVVKLAVYGHYVLGVMREICAFLDIKPFTVRVPTLKVCLSPPRGRDALPPACCEYHSVKAR